MADMRASSAGASASSIGAIPSSSAPRASAWALPANAWASRISSAIVAVLDCVGQPLREACTRSAASHSVSTRLPGVLEMPSVKAPVLRASRSAANTAGVDPPELMPTTSVCASATAAP